MRPMLYFEVWLCSPSGVFGPLGGLSVRLQLAEGEPPPVGELVASFGTTSWRRATIVQDDFIEEMCPED